MENILNISALFVRHIKMFEDWGWYVLENGFSYEEGEEMVTHKV